MNTIFASADLMEVAASDPKANFMFEHVADQGNGYRVRPFKRVPGGHWMRCRDFVVVSQARTASRVLNEYSALQTFSPAA